jgi:hypothetical protein
MIVPVPAAGAATSKAYTPLNMILHIRIDSTSNVELARN